MIELNPLDVLRSREVKSMPPHFSTMKISDNERYDYQIIDWLTEKTIGRYSINAYPNVSSNQFKTSTFVGFEEEKELTYFMLACPYLRRN